MLEADIKSFACEVCDQHEHELSLHDISPNSNAYPSYAPIPFDADTKYFMVEGDFKVTYYGNNTTTKVVSMPIMADNSIMESDQSWVILSIDKSISTDTSKTPSLFCSLKLLTPGLYDTKIVKVKDQLTIDTQTTKHISAFHKDANTECLINGAPITAAGPFYEIQGSATITTNGVTYLFLVEPIL